MTAWQQMRSIEEKILKNPGLIFDERDKALSKLVSFDVHLQWFSGATYYIDFVSGNDAAAGTSPATAWKTIPGSRNVGNTADISTDWGSGTFNSTNKVPAGTTFRLKPGQTWSSTYGGYILMSATYYAINATYANPITIEAYQAWPSASGTVTFDGTGITLAGTTGYGLIQVTVGGVYFNGNVASGITVQNSTWRGISANNATGALDGVSCNDLLFYNNLTACSTSSIAVSEAQFGELQAMSGALTNCVFDGGNQFSNGFIFGETTRYVTGYTVTNCEFKNHKGDSNNSSGCGFKGYNSQVTFKNCTMHGNYRGCDLGENGGANAVITFKVINCRAYSNTQKGITFNGPGYSYSGAVTFYAINSTSYSNGSCGFQCYAGPYNLYLVGCVADGNGDASGTGNYMFWQDTGDGPQSVFIYNCIGYKPGVYYQSANIVQLAYWKTGAYSFTLDSDYNCWRQNSTEDFCMWDYQGRSAQVEFTYAQGPGSISTNWYNWYDYNTTPPPQGLGHYHADAHSVTTEPPFNNLAGHDYNLKAHFPGTDLSGKPWYIPEMGFDANGRTRVSWDIGAYDYVVSGISGGGIFVNLIDRLLGEDIKIHAYSGVSAGTSILNLNDYSVNYNLPSLMGAIGTGVQLDITSSSANDVMTSGSGAWQITIVGLDPNFKPQVKTYNLNGPTAVTTGDYWLRVFAAYIAAVGTGLYQAGDIYIIKTGTSTWTAGVPATLTSAIVKIVFTNGIMGVGYSGYWTVPATLPGALPRKAKIQGITLGVAAQNTRFLIQVQPNLDNVAPLDSNLATAWEVIMSGTGGGPGWVDLKRHIEDFTPGTDIIMKHIPLAAGAIVSAALDIKMV